VSGSFLERTLASTLPTFQQEWRELRRTYPDEAPPSADDFLGHLVAHVHHSLAEGRVAEVKRLFLAVERLLVDADPILQELLETGLLARLADECRESSVDPALILPHLGPKSRVAWNRAQRASQDETGS
jgi:hypothetical protein